MQESPFFPRIDLLRCIITPITQHCLFVSFLIQLLLPLSHLRTIHLSVWTRTFVFSLKSLLLMIPTAECHCIFCLLILNVCPLLISCLFFFGGSINSNSTNLTQEKLISLQIFQASPCVLCLACLTNQDMKLRL